MHVYFIFDLVYKTCHRMHVHYCNLKGMNFSPLEVHTVQVHKLWENPEGTKSTRATIALINGYRRVTLGKYFRILKEDESKRLHLPLKQWLPEKKGKHLCLGPCEVKGLCDNLKQILESLEEANHFSDECDRRASAAAAAASASGSGSGCVYPRVSYPNANADAIIAAAAATGKKRGRKPKSNSSNSNSSIAKADSQEECDGGYDSGCGSQAKRQHNDAD